MADPNANTDLGIFAKDAPATTAPTPDLGIFAKDTPASPVVAAPSHDLGIFAKPEAATATVAPSHVDMTKPVPFNSHIATDDKGNQSYQSNHVVEDNSKLPPAPVIPPYDATKPVPFGMHVTAGADGKTTYAPDVAPKAFKRSFDPQADNSIYKDKQLAQTARAYYKEKGEDPGSDNAAIDKFISDRTWASGNTAYGLQDAAEAGIKPLPPGADANKPGAVVPLGYHIASDGKGGKTFVPNMGKGPDSPEQLKRFAYLREYWNAPDNLPTITDKGGRDFGSAALQYGLAGLTDPINAIGGLVGKAVTETVGHAAGYLANLGVAAGTNAALDAESQATDIKLGSQKEYRPLQTAEAAGMGALTHVGGAALTSTIGNELLPKVNPDPAIEAFKRYKIGPADTPPMANIQGPVGSFIQGLFEKGNPIAVFQKKATGVGRSVKSLKDETLRLQGLGTPGGPSAPPGMGGGRAGLMGSTAFTPPAASTAPVTPPPVAPRATMTAPTQHLALTNMTAANSNAPAAATAVAEAAGEVAAKPQDAAVLQKKIDRLTSDTADKQAQLEKWQGDPDKAARAEAMQADIAANQKELDGLKAKLPQAPAAQTPPPATPAAQTQVMLTKSNSFGTSGTSGATANSNVVGGAPPASSPLAVSGAPNPTTTAGAPVPPFTPRDPALLPFFQFSQLTSTVARAQHMFEVGGILPPDQNAPVGTASYQFGTAPSLGEIVHPFMDSGDTGNFYLYAYAKRAQQIKTVRNPALVNNGQKPIDTMFDDPEYWASQGFAPNEVPMKSQEMIDRIIAQGDANPEYVDALAKQKLYGDNLLDYQHQSGLISDLSRSKITQAGGGTAWVPGYQASDAAATAKSAAGVANAPNSPARANLHGSTENVAPFLSSIMQATYKAIKASDTNRFKLSLYDMLDEAEARGEGFDAHEYVPASERMTMMKSFYGSAKNAMVKAGATVEDDIDRLKTQVNPTTGKNYTASEAFDELMFSGGNTPPDFIEAFGMNPLPHDMTNVDTFFRDGKIQFVRLKDKGLINTMQAMRGDTPKAGVLAWADNTARGFSKLYSGLVTADPRFVAKNLTRDTISATINSQFGFKPVIDSVGGVAKTWMDNEGYRQFLVNGAGGSGMYKSELHDTAAMMENYKQGNSNAVMKGVMDYMRDNHFTNGWQGIQNFIEHFEMGPRFQEALAAQKAGMSPLTAAYAGQELSTNFARAGSWSGVRKVTSWTPFLNAGIQGMYRVGITAKDNPVRTAAMVGSLIAAPMLISHIANSGNPLYDNIPEAVRYQNVWFPVPESASDWAAWYANGGVGAPPKMKMLIPFPAPYDYGGFGTAAMHLYDAIKDHSGAEAANGFYQAFQGMMPGLSLPAVAQMPYHLLTNTDWTGSPITPGNVQGLSPEMQFSDRTSEFGKWFANKEKSLGIPDKVRLTPIETDYITNFFMTGILNYIPQIANAAWRAQEIGSKGVPPTPRADEFSLNQPMNILSKAWGVIPAPNRSSQAMNDLYQIKTRVDQFVKDKNVSAKSLELALDPTGVMKSDDLKASVGSFKTLSDWVTANTNIKQAIQNIADNPDPNLTADQKRNQIDALKSQQEQYAITLLNHIHALKPMDVITGELFDRNPSEHAKDRQTPGYTWLWNLFHGAKDVNSQTNAALAK
jgi:Large polyvalent protein associated domain 38